MKVIAVLTVSVILAGMLFSGLYFDMAGNTGVTLLGFVKGHLTESLLIFLFFVAAGYSLIDLLYKSLDRINARLLARSSAKKARHQYKALLLYWGCILICWLPYLIVCFPASSMGWDYFWQLLQGSGVVPLCNHHPIFGSLLYGALYKVGFLFGGAQGGLFFTGLFQVLLMSFSMAYALTTAKEVGTPGPCLGILTVFTCICPVFASHAVWLIKDSIYSSMLVILLASFVRLHIGDGRDKMRLLACIIPISVFALLCRKEGVVIVILLHGVSLLISIRGQRDGSVKGQVVLFAVLLAAFIGINVGISSLGVSISETSREGLTLQSAQVIDVLRKHPEDLSGPDEAVLRNAYESIENAMEEYDEQNRDPIKIKNLNVHETMNYLKVWARLGIRHFGDYCDSFLRGTSGYWWLFRSPAFIAHPTPLYAPEGDFANDGTKNALAMNHKWLKQVYKACGTETDKTIGELVEQNNPDLKDVFTVKSAFPEAREWLVNALEKWKGIPMLQLVFVPGFYLWMAIVSLGYLFLRRRRLFLQCMPIMLIVIFNFFSPINGYMRYFLPVALASVLLTGLCFAEKVSLHSSETGTNDKDSGSDSIP